MLCLRRHLKQAWKHSRGRCRIVAVSEMISWQFFESAQNRRVLLIEPVVVLEKQIFGESPRQLDAQRGDTWGTDTVFLSRKTRQTGVTGRASGA